MTSASAGRRHGRDHVRATAPAWRRSRSGCRCGCSSSKASGGRRRRIAAQGVHQPGDRRDLGRGADRRRGLPVVPRHLRAGQARHARTGAGPDLDGNDFEAEGEGLYARALQHETDHLNGRLLIDQVGPVKREIIKRKLRKDAEAAGGKSASEDASSAGRARPDDRHRMTAIGCSPHDVPDIWLEDSRMLTIALAGIEFDGRHGATPSSAARRASSMRRAGGRRRGAVAERSDLLADTVDYSQVAEVIVGVGTGEPHHLLESLARRMLDAVRERSRGYGACVSSCASSTRPAARATPRTRRCASKGDPRSSARPGRPGPRPGSPGARAPS